MISNLAMRLLRTHAANPGRYAYETSVLGSIFRDADLDRLDQAYVELKEQNLMENAGVTVSYFGVPKALLKVTQLGLAEAAKGSAA